MARYLLCSLNMRLSIIIPVYNDAQNLVKCLSGLISAREHEIIVVDDGSTDASAAAARQYPVRLVQRPSNMGPAAARNEGARVARGDILLFLDADVVVAPATVRRVVEAFETDPVLAALFGSYDAFPTAPSLVSQYRNLLHHFVHQHGTPEASTFWAGCGAVRRSVFETLGGFDETRFRHPSIEDIEFGVRLHRAGYRIRLDASLQVTHLKAWTLASIIRTDIFRRAIPWARLIMERRLAANTLNLSIDQRISGALIVLALAFGLLCLLGRFFVVGAVLSLLAGVSLNLRLYAFFLRKGRLRLLAVAVPLHVLYLLYSSFSYLGVWIWFAVHRRSDNAGTWTASSSALRAPDAAPECSRGSRGLGSA